MGLLGLGVASLGLGASPGARAQEADDPSAAFGGYTASGRGNGVQFTYDVPNVFPLPSPLFQASMPESNTTLESGPTATALGSVAYPGNIVANLPAVIAQGSPEGAAFVPPYPILARSDYPAGPPEASQDIGTARSSTRAAAEGAEAVTTMGGGELPPFVTMGNITTSARTGFVDGLIESRGRVEITDVSLFYGLFHVDSIVTDLVATTNGTEAASAGGTTLSGLTFLGLPATLGPDGIVVGEAPSGPADAGPATPIVEGAGDLGPVGDGLNQAFAPLNEALRNVLGTTNASAQQLLDATGISIRTLEPFESVDGPSAERTANGVVITMTYDGSSDNPLAQLIAAIPSDQLPGEGIPGFPVNTSPQALVNLMKETHITGVALAYGNVSVDATPAFEFQPAGGLSPSGAGSALAGGAVSPGFSTPAPALAPAGTAGTAALPGSTPAGALGGAAGAAVVILAVLSAPFWAVGSRNLADNVLGIAGSSCPDGLDQPLKGG